MKEVFLSLFLVSILPNAIAQPGIQWQKSFGSTNDDGAFAIKQTSDGGYIVAGWSDGSNTDVMGNHGFYDYWLVKTNGTGSIQWEKSLGGTEDDIAQFVQQTTDGGYVVVGYSMSTDLDVTGNHGMYDYWVVKLNDTGGIQWQKSLGGSDYDWPYSIQQTTDGGYIVAGWSYSTDGDVTGNHGEWDYWVVKLNDTGGIEWEKSLGGSGADEANSMQQTTDGGYIVAGSTNSTDGDVTGYHGGGDYWIVKLNNTGGIQWQKCMGGTDPDIAYCVQQTTDGGYVLAGVSRSTNGDATVNYGNHDYWVVKLEGTTSVNEINKEYNVTISPNPTSGNIVIKGTGVAKIEVSNAIGQVMKEVSGADRISISEFAIGMYFVRVYNEQGEMIHVEKVIKQ